jgi:hypothetical protein
MATVLYIFVVGHLTAQDFDPNGFDTVSVELPFTIDGATSNTPDFDTLTFALTASDGTHYEYIKLSWAEPRSGLYYRVLRGTSPQVTEMQEISRGWKRSNWLVDNLGLRRGITYYYFIEATIGSTPNRIKSVVDSGFLKLDDVYATPPIGRKSTPPH